MSIWHPARTLADAVLTAQVLNLFQKVRRWQITAFLGLDLSRFDFGLESGLSRGRTFAIERGLIPSAGLSILIP